jgi:hypothetical protein
VNTAVYDSDSSDDGEGVVESRKKKSKEVDEDEDDMFALGEKEEKGQDTGERIPYIHCKDTKAIRKSVKCLPQPNSLLRV